MADIFKNKLELVGKLQIEGQIGRALKGSIVCSAVHTWSLSSNAAAAAAFLPSDRCPAVTSAAAAAVALPPPARATGQENTEVS